MRLTDAVETYDRGRRQNLSRSHSDLRSASPASRRRQSPRPADVRADHRGHPVRCRRAPRPRLRLEARFKARRTARAAAAGHYRWDAGESHSVELAQRGPALHVHNSSSNNMAAVTVTPRPAAGNGLRGPHSRGGRYGADHARRSGSGPRSGGVFRREPERSDDPASPELVFLGPPRGLPPVVGTRRGAAVERIDPVHHDVNVSVSGVAVSDDQGLMVREPQRLQQAVHRTVTRALPSRRMQWCGPTFGSRFSGAGSRAVAAGRPPALPPPMRGSSGRTSSASMPIGGTASGRGRGATTRG